MKNIFYALFIMSSVGMAQVSQATISGTITSNGEPVPYASIYIKDTATGTSADANGNYQLTVPTGEIKLVAQSQGFRGRTKALNLPNGDEEIVNFILAEGNDTLDEVVITGTRTEKRQTDSPGCQRYTVPVPLEVLSTY